MGDIASQVDGLPQDFRTAMRGLASTVTVISIEHQRQRYGMVATAVMSVSLEPPALAICVNKQASIHRPICLRGSFAVNVLSKQQEFVSQHFSHSQAEDRFERGNWISYRGSNFSFLEIPYLEDAQAVLFCEIREQLIFGTHSLFVAQVSELRGRDSLAPLIYCDGSYGSFSAS